MPWAQTQLQVCMPWQQSGESVCCVWAGTCAVGPGMVVAPAVPWEWQCVVLALCAIPVWTEAIAGPASSIAAVSCQSSRTEITDFSRGRHILIANTLDHWRRELQP